MGKNREKYEKPVLRAIELVADEVLGLGCLKATSGQNAGNPLPGCSAGGCSKLGTS
jgi:hypothetical protein